MIFKKKQSTRDMVKSKSNASSYVSEDEEADPIKRGEKPPKVKKQSYRRGLKPNHAKILFGILAIVIGLSISLVGIPVLRAKTTQVVPVYIFSESVSRGTQITEDMLDNSERSSYNIPSDLVTDKSQIVGGFLMADVISGDLATAGRVSTSYLGDHPALADLPEGKLAVSITLAGMSQSVSSMLRSGDIIQIFSVAKETDSEDIPTTHSPASLQYVEILAVTDTSGLEASTANQTLVNTITIIANRMQVQELVLLEHTSILHAALAVRGDDEAKATALAVQEDYWIQLEAQQIAEGEQVPATTPTPEGEQEVTG